MASMNDLSAEILLGIFHDPVSSMFDCIRFSKTTSRWRELIHKSSLAQERMWLQPDRALPHMHKPRIKADSLSVLMVVRQLPATIWNDYRDELWEMTWRHDHECPTLPWPRNPIFEHLEEFMHIVNPHFIVQPPYAGCEARMPSTTHKSLVFSGLKDLERKMEMPRTTIEESWKNMLISQHLVTKINMHFELFVKYRVRSPISPTTVWYHCKTEAAPGKEFRMKDLVYVFRKSMKQTLKVLEMQGLPRGWTLHDMPKPYKN